ncbi:Glycosyltransferase involved in cell wall bisynthesis [Paracoccus isoporae]|uniref:Glycosyltransferase involved in cell wall bisynthesis n=2 Tax=Paracoccus isoporae TaxID=591205 RepID=A0A1G6UCI8_9RHOB|nr:Glycosyltransferase involved in cell wall bisynthesis [Paracoccus isoporae]
MMLYRYLRALDARRHDHLVVSVMPPGEIGEMIRELGVEVVDLGAQSGRDLGFAVRRFQTVIAGTQARLVHGWMYHGCLVATLALLLSRRSDIGLIWAIHHSLSDLRLEKRATRVVLRALRCLSGRADRITYCSRRSAAQHIAFGLPPNHWEFLPNAVDSAEFSPDAEARSRLCALTGIPPQRKIIGTIGRSHPMKDHTTFARTIARLIADGVDAHGVLIGDGQPNGAAMAEALRCGIADRLTALRARRDIPQLVPGLDLYLLSSAWGEALPLAVAEAMAAGVPAVVTDIGDCAWLVEGCGAVCPPGEPEALAKAARGLLELSAADRVVLSEACRRRVAEFLSMNEYILRHADLYRRVRRRRCSTPRQEAA